MRVEGLSLTTFQSLFHPTAPRRSARETLLHSHVKSTNWQASQSYGQFEKVWYFSNLYNQYTIIILLPSFGGGGLTYKRIPKSAGGTSIMHRRVPKPSKILQVSSSYFLRRLEGFTDRRHPCPNQQRRHQIHVSGYICHLMRQFHQWRLHSFGQKLDSQTALCKPQPISSLLLMQPSPYSQGSRTGRPFCV